MQKVQNRGMRIILKCDKQTKEKIMLDSLGWLSIAQKIKYNVLVMIYKTKIDLVPNYLSDETMFVSVNAVNLRNPNDFRLPNYKTKIKNEEYN